MGARSHGTQSHGRVTAPTRTRKHGICSSTRTAGEAAAAVPFWSCSFLRQPPCGGVTGTLPAADIASRDWANPSRPQSVASAAAGVPHLTG
jgi:hypothetical protein